MVRLSMLAAASLIALVPAAANAQPTRSADDYVCALSGKCGDQPAADQSKDAPETKGFSLGIKRGPAPDQAVAAPTTKGFTLGRNVPGAAPAKPAANNGRFSLGTKPAPKAVRPAKVASRPTVRPAAAMAPSRRVDLRLSFENGSADLTSQAREEARVFAEAMKRPELSGKRFLIEGHTDAKGVRAANIELSQRRAAAVADYLASLGVERSRIETRGVGPDQPLPGKRRADPANRRVEAELL